MKNLISKLFFLVFAFVGITLIISSFKIGKVASSFMETAKETTGTIVMIADNVNNDGEVYHNVVVEYKVKGRTYKEKSNYYSSSMREGQSIKIYYDPDNPRNIQTGGDKASSLAFWIMFFMGAVFTCVGVVPLLSGILKKSNTAALKKNGELEYCKIISIDQDTTVSVNGRYSDRITFERTNPDTGESGTYRSQRIWEDVYQYVAPGDSVPVYFDRKNNKKFLVDFSGNGKKQDIIESNI